MAALSAGQTVLNQEIVSTFIYTMYGDRTPFVLPQNPTLTPLGAQQLYQAGANIRARYVTPSSNTGANESATIRNISPYEIFNDEISVSSTDDQWVVASAQAFMQGLYPPLESSSNYTYIRGQSYLANGTNVVAPLNGYQYATIHTSSANDLDSIYLQGSQGCPMYTAASAQYYSTPFYQELQTGTAEFYSSLEPQFLSGIFEEASVGYFDAYFIWDYLNYAYLHNTTVASSLDEESMTRASILAADWAFAMNTNTSLYGLNPGDQIGVMAGKTLAYNILKSFYTTINTQGATNKLTLAFGSYEPMIAFAALSELISPMNAAFYNLPEPGASFVFELLTLTADDDTTYPSVDDLFVRFLYRNGTGNDTELVAYPLFGYSPSDDLISLSDFLDSMQQIAISSIEASSRHGLHPAVAGVIAGVVPSLGDCAVTSRRSSTYRARGWSSASFDTSDDTGFFGSNINSTDIAKPERQPVPPPTEHLAEKDVGFAKFLKTHSSPTHNRVTAGGRIVPMEKREALPRFHMPDPERVAARSDASLTWSNNVGRLGTPNAEPQTSVNGQLPGANPSDADAGLENFPCAEMNAISSGQMLSSCSYFTPQFPCLALQPPMVYAGYAGSFADSQNLAMINATVGGCADVHLQSVYSTGQMVQDADALFNNLDHQLRLIDRHRAMISHDPNLAAQRMAVVQQRAEAKEQIHRLKAQLQAEQSPSAYFHPMAFSSRVPATFVPIATTPMHHPVASPASMATSTIRPNALIEKPFPGTKRKAIPIVPPPAPSPTQAEPCKKPNPAATTKAKLQQRYSARDSHGNDGPLGSDVEQSCTVLQQSCGNHSAKCQVVVARDRGGQRQDKRQQRESCVAKGHPRQEQVEPEDVETIYELQLDAMRLPEGVNVLITLSNGAHVSVPGSRLGRPQSSQMSDFERQYWGRKPKYTTEMLERLKARATIQGGGGPISDEYLITNADGPPATPPRERGSKQNGSCEQRVQKYVDEQSTSRVQEERAAGARPGSRVASAVAVAAASANVMTGTRADESLLGEKESSMPADKMSQKGYSSVLVQNINVEVQLPPPGLDGATDPNGRSAAVLSLTATGKQPSPRLLHRSAPNGGA
ncbi:hypothetical protein DV736_g4034, partial [Chaetothyriales sp. CBS 134916]